MKSANVVVLLVGLALAGFPSAAVYAQEQQQDQSFHAYPPEEPQGSYSQTWHDGFNSGRDAANHDVEAGLPAKAPRHKEYNRPDLSPMASEDFREGFRTGYKAVYDHFLGIGWHPTADDPAPKH